MADLRTLPAIRAEAERAACEFWNAVAERYNAANHPSMCEWRHVDPRIQNYRIEAHLDLLCDLTRPASRDVVARLVAEKLGLVCGAMAPDLARFVCGEHCCDGTRGRMVPCSLPIWSMMGANETQMVTFADCPDPGEWDGDEHRHVPGISVVTDPAEALRLIALHVLGAERVDAALVRS